MPEPETLPPYSGNAHQCVKCGATEADSTYMSRGCCDHDLETVIYDHQGTGFERMHRRCRRCGYQWDELPLDAVKQQREAAADAEDRASVMAGAHA